MARAVVASNVDPLIDSAQTAAPDSDFASHLTMYNTFVHLLQWFVIHLAILMVGLYSWVIAHNGGIGIFLIILAFAVLAFGIVRLTTVPRDLANSTVPHSPPSGAAHA